MYTAALLTVATVVAASAAGPPAINGAVQATALAERQLVPVIGGCRIFPADNAWNMPVANLPLRAGSDQTIAKIQSIGGHFVHPDVGSDFGIPFVVVPADQPLVPVTFTDAPDESDPGPYPIPPNAPVEAGSDAHVLVLRQGVCDLFEMGDSVRHGNGSSWSAYSGAHFDLSSNALRPAGWTSADAAGLPILPGLVRYDEVAAGAIRHAIRVTFSQTQNTYIAPATHKASSRSDPTLPPMGLRLRLRADYDISRFTGQARVIAIAMQQYGLIVADNGSNWYFQGAPDPRWDDEDLDQLKSVPGTAFEVVDTGPTHS